MVTVILLAGGSGTRISNKIAKQHIMVSNHQIIEYTLKAFSNCDFVDRIIVASNPQYVDCVKKMQKCFPKLADVCLGGETRILSAFNALKKIESTSDDDDIIIISDAARPCITKSEINAIITKFDEYDVVTSCISCYETVLFINDGSIKKIIPRDGLFRQTSPEAYRFKVLKKLYFGKSAKSIKQYTNIGLDKAILGGFRVGYVLSNPLNFKITTEKDLKLFESIVNSNFEELINS